LVNPADAFARVVLAGGKPEAEFTKQIGLSQSVPLLRLGFAAAQQRKRWKRTIAAAR